MSDTEKNTATDLVEQIKDLPPAAADYVRGYMQGVSDMAKDAPKKETP